MARSHATIYASAWSPESDFRHLDAATQWLYVALLAQADLNLCGVMPYIPSRWARFAADLSVADVEDLAAQLEEHGYIVIDHDTVELWVRSFMYHDRVFAQPQVAMAAATAFGSVQSSRLRELITASVPPGIRHGWPTCLRGVKRDEARALLEGCDAASWKPSVTPNATPSGRGAGSPETPLAEGSGSGSGSGSGVGFIGAPLQNPPTPHGLRAVGDQP